MLFKSAFTSPKRLIERFFIFYRKFVSFFFSVGVIDDHVKMCNRRISPTEIVQDKGHHIVEFIKAYQPSSGGSIKRRRMTSKKIKRTRHGRRSRKYTRNLRRNKYRK